MDRCNALLMQISWFLVVSSVLLVTFSRLVLLLPMVLLLFPGSMTPVFFMNELGFPIILVFLLPGIIFSLMIPGWWRVGRLVFAGVFVRRNDMATRGMMLIELLIVVACMSILVGSIYPALNSVDRLDGLLADHQAALLCCERVFERLRSGDLVVGEGVRELDSEQLQCSLPGARATLALAPYRQPGLYVASLQVRWQWQSAQRSCRLETLMYREAKR